MHFRLSGLIAATYTPLGPDGSLNLDEVPRMVSYLERSGIQGLYICGSTGEGVSLSGSERRELAETYVESARGRLATIVHVGHNSLREARELAKHAQSIGADVVSATAPSYFPIKSPETLADSMAEIASGAPNLPFYYYHIPHMTGVETDMVDFLQTAPSRIPTLAGIKFTSFKICEYQECRHVADGKFDIVWGFDEALLGALAVGAQSAIGSTYNIAAPLYTKLIDAFQRGDVSAARRYQLLSLDLIRILNQYPFHSAVKAILERLGVPCGPSRLPQMSLTDEMKQELHIRLDAAGISRWLFDGDFSCVATGPPAPKSASFAANALAGQGVSVQHGS